MAGLAQAVQQRCVSSFEHIKGHVGHVWNELADAAAKARAKAIIPGCVAAGGPVQEYLARPEAHGWLWFIIAQYSNSEGKWPSMCDSCIATELPEHAVREDIWKDVRAMLKPVDADKEGVRVQPTVATANVLTLCPSLERKEQATGGLMLAVHVQGSGP